MRPITAAICLSLLSLTGAQAELVSCHKPDGLILSTGNLYFTSRDAGGAAVWRTSQGATACQERILYWETGAIFGDIVFAELNGNFFGYFFAEKAEVSTLRRVPLAGGNATILATVNRGVVHSRRNLVTDHLNVYWQDGRAVRKIPLGGGNVTVLDQTPPQKITAGIAQRNDAIIYASGDEIRFVPKAGAITTPLIRIIAKASSPVTALHVVSNGVYWGERSGAVRLKVGSTITTLQPPSSLIPTSISSNGFAAGGMVAFTLCGSQSCRLRIDSPGSTGGGFPISTDALGVSVLSSGKIFWGDAAGVHRR